MSVQFPFPPVSLQKYNAEHQHKLKQDSPVLTVGSFCVSRQIERPITNDMAFAYDYPVRIDKFDPPDDLGRRVMAVTVFDFSGNPFEIGGEIWRDQGLMMPDGTLYDASGENEEGYMLGPNAPGSPQSEDKNSVAPPINRPIFLVAS